MIQVEVRADKVHIVGYVNAVGRDSRPIMTKRGKVVEQIEPGAFREALQRADNVKLLLNHVKEKVYAQTKDKTLKLTEDSIGLRAEVDITDEELAEKAREKKLKGWSFGAYMDEDRIEERAGDIPRRIVSKLDIFEVSLIDDRMNPCYVGTSIEQRASGEIEIEQRARMDEIEVRKEEIAPVHDYSKYENRIKELTKAE